MENEMNQPVQVKENIVLKIVKQPFFIMAVVAFVLSAVVAIVGSAVNPAKSAVIDKYAKAFQEEDVDLLSECYSSTADMEEEELALLIAAHKLVLVGKEIKGDVTVEYLYGDAKKETLEDGSEVTYIPAIKVIKSRDRVKDISLDGKAVIEVDGKEYLYTGRE